MNEKKVLEYIKSCIEKMYKDDKELFFYDTVDPLICERTLSSRLAHYLQNEVSNLNVDCEYNKSGLDIKKNLENSKIYPDIILHNRKSNSKNICWIEVKKNNSSAENIKLDKDRLCEVTSKISYNYKFGVLIIFGESLNKSSITFFSKGVERFVLNLTGEKINKI